jgi:hypothetical protein
MRCALSGQVTRHPVVTPRGYVFERSEIEAYLQTASTCPMDGQPISPQELVDLHITPPGEHPALLQAPSFGDYSWASNPNGTPFRLNFNPLWRLHGHSVETCPHLCDIDKIKSLFLPLYSSNQL